MAKKPRLLVVSGGARAVPARPLTAEDIYEIRKKKRDRRVTTSPFGLTPEELASGKKMLVVGDAVPWKGLKVKDVGAKFYEVASKYVGKKGVGVVNGLRKAIAISKAYAGVEGVGIDPETGRYMPKKAIAQKKWEAEKKGEVDELASKIKFPGESVGPGDILVGIKKKAE